MCELFPRHAKIADKFNLIRSVCHEFADHGGGHKRFLTGRLPASPVGTVNDAPAVTSIVSKMLSRADQPMPTSVACVDGGSRCHRHFCAWSGLAGTEHHAVHGRG